MEIGYIGWKYIIIYDHWIKHTMPSQYQWEKKVLPPPKNVNVTLYLAGSQQTLRDINPLPWNFKLNCFASVINTCVHYSNIWMILMVFIFIDWLIDWFPKHCLTSIEQYFKYSQTCFKGQLHVAKSEVMGIIAWLSINIYDQPYTADLL